MKKLYMILSAAALILGGCNYNDYNLDGFEEEFGNGAPHADVQNIEYTLADADYKTIAGYATNKSLAEAAGATDALTAIGNNRYFVTKEDAQLYLPAFINANYAWVDNNSTASITYRMASDMPEQLAAMNSMKEYTLTAGDYQTAWGSDKDYTEALTPATVGRLQSIIPTEGLEAGDYVAVTYKYSASEPTFEQEGEEPADGYTTVLGKAFLNDEVTVRGYVVAASSQGIVVADNGGAILLYQTTGFEVGDEVTVSGKITAYNNGFQIEKNNVASIEKTGTTTPVYPEALDLTGAKMDEILVRTTNEYQIFVKVTDAEVQVSGNYYNFSVAGATAATGSFYGLTDAQKAQLKNGDKVTFYGYLSSISKSGGAPKFVNIIPTHIGTEPGGAATPAGYTSVLGKAALNDTVDIRGYVVAASSQGIVVADNGGAILLYQTNGYAVGDEVTVSGKITAYNNGFQIEKNNVASIEKTGTTTVKYPEAMDLTGAKMDEILVRTTNEYQIFVKVTDAEVQVSGNYYNFSVAGATAATGSFYGLTDAQKAQLTNGAKVTFYGYLSSISKSSGAPKFVNIIPTHIGTAPAAVSAAPATYAAAATRAVTVASEERFALFSYNGSTFTAADATVVQPADYKAMGQSYNNLTDPAQDTYLPKYLLQANPYASAGDEVFVSYICRKNNENIWATDHYKFDGSAWTKAEYFTEKLEQFRKTNGTWAVDPTLEISYTTAGAEDFKAFCQYCANWVYDNIDVALGADPRDNAGEILSPDAITVGGDKPAGKFFVSNYGNNEWFAGSYAYYGEMNWRATSNTGSARDSYEHALAAIKEKGLDMDINIDPDIFSKSDAEIEIAVVAAMTKNAAVVFQNVLHYMYPDVTPEQYTKVVLNVYNYFDKATTGVRAGVYSYTFTVVGTGEFEYVEDSFVLL